MSRNSNQLSVAELLARNGQQPAAGGGRRRRGGRGVPVSELSGDLPVVAGGTHAADEDEEPAGSPPGYPAAGNGYSPHDYAGEQVSGGEPSRSPMSGPITVYNPLAPDQGDAPPARLGEPVPYPAEEPAVRRGGRRRRAEPDDEQPAAGSPAADPAARPWETGPPLPSGGRAARRRAAEAAEAAAAQDSAPPAPESPDAYGLPPAVGNVDPFPAPAPEFGHPDMGPPGPAPEGGPPRLGPPVPAAEAWSGPVPAAEAWSGPAPATEAWPAPAPADDPRPKLERRRRGTRSLPDPAPWPQSDEGTNADHATTVWSPAEPGQWTPPGPPDLAAALLEQSGRRRGKRDEQPGAPALLGPGFPAPGPPPPDIAADDGFRNTDMYATDVHGPMPPAPGPMPPAPGPMPPAPGSMPREHGTDTGGFEPDSDFYEVPEDEAGDEPRMGRSRLSRVGKLGAVGPKFGGASGKLAAVRSRLAVGGWERGSAAATDPRKQWVVLGVQSVGAALAGMVLFKGFEMLWEMQPLAALALAVVVILGLVALVRILRRTDDIFSTVIAVVVGVFVTLGPLAFLLSAG